MKIKKLIGILFTITVIIIILFAWFYFVNKNPLEQFIPTIMSKALGAKPKFFTNIYGDGSAELNSPESIALDESGNIYVTDTENHRITIFNTDGMYLRHIGSNSPGPGQLYYPYGVLASQGQVYVADGYQGLIKVYTKKGKYLKTFVSRDKSGKRILSVGPMAMDDHGLIYTIDMQGARILVYQKDGRLLRTMGYHGKDFKGGFSFPNGITINENGNLLITDAGNQRVVEMTRSGKFVRQILGEKGKKGQPFSILRGIAVDSKNRILVVDTILHGVHVFTQEGEPLFVLGEMGFDEGQLLYPIGIAIDKTRGRIYIADSNNNRIAIWRY